MYIVIAYRSPSDVVYTSVRHSDDIPTALNQLKGGVGEESQLRIERSTKIVCLFARTVYVNNIAFEALEQLLAGWYDEMKDFFVRFRITPKVAEIVGLPPEREGEIYFCQNDSAKFRQLIAQGASSMPPLRRQNAQSDSPLPIKLDEEPSG